MFERSLLDVVKGLRAHKDDESKFISDCIRECKEELASTNKELKAVAISKLTYLYMFGYDMEWAAFWVVEVMSQAWFGHKRVAYLAASQSFGETTEVSLLTVHSFKKAFTVTGANSQGLAEGSYEVAAAINCLANIVNPELAQELLSDVLTLLNNSKPYVRKKTVLVLYKIFRQYPKALRLSFPRLKEKLEDDDMGVISAAVNVICELARKNPANYLSLAPILYKLLTTSSNNWMLIKIVKLLGALVPEEPRLGKKLIDPLTHLINTTPAKSLLYECIVTVIASDACSRDLTSMCLEKLKLFIEDPDQNLKYLGLLGLHKLMLRQPRVVSEYKDLVLDCLKDEDVSIRMRALDLLAGMVSSKNLTTIVKKLMDHLECSLSMDSHYLEAVMTRIVEMCSGDNYACTHDFEWYIGVLVDLTFAANGLQVTKLLADQILDVVVRVPAIRFVAVRAMSTLLLECTNKEALGDVIYAAAFVIGEFHVFVDSHNSVIESLLDSKSTLKPFVQATLIQAAFKIVLSAWSRCLPQESEDSVQLPMSEWRNLVQVSSVTFLNCVSSFCGSSHMEVQERAVSYEFLVSYLISQTKESDISDENLINLAKNAVSFMNEPLNPVHPQAQSKVSVPDELDLDKPIFSIQELPENELLEDAFFEISPSKLSAVTNDAEKVKTSSPNEKSIDRRLSHSDRVKHDPFYLQDPKSKLGDSVQVSEEAMNTVKEDAETTSTTKSRGSQLMKQVASGRKRDSFVVLKTEDMPVTSHSSKISSGKAQLRDSIDLIDLTSPLRSDEVVKSTMTYAEMQLEKEKAREKAIQIQEKEVRKHNKRDKNVESENSRNILRNSARVADNKELNLLDFDVLAPVAESKVPVDTFDLLGDVSIKPSGPKNDKGSLSSKDRKDKNVLCSNTNISLSCFQRPSSKESSCVTLEFNLDFLPSLNAPKLLESLLHFSLSKHPSCHLLPGINVNIEENDIVLLPNSISKVYFKVDSIELPLVIDIKLYCTVENSKGKREKIKLPGVLSFSISSFIDFHRMTTEKFSMLIAEQKGMFSEKCSIKVSSLKRKLKESIGVGLVEENGTSATFYGKTIHSENLFLLVKTTDKDSTVEIKSSNKKLALLIRETVASIL